MPDLIDHRFYGRRISRPLRVGQARLQAEFLPRLRLACPPGAVAESLDPRSLFPLLPADSPIWLEIGFGGGEHLAAQAAAHPKVGMIGCEVFVTGVAKLLHHIAEGGIENIRIRDEDARPLLALLQPRSLERVFILFPDPWPKKRHHRRRIVNADNLDRLARLMVPGAELRLATDDPLYQAAMLEVFSAHSEFIWLARRPEDWLVRPADWPETRYERKAIAAGRVPWFFTLIRK
ncbi:MAG: tRNA (guanosine(46)-N7)-methyltransferase TrmB [Candidatus Pacebacteria bacterium]|nr:tRNA (guanosine(46)-N7)-methyltransferase TrmB [Candidatus Paceibacterota bacterium]